MPSSVQEVLSPCRRDLRLQRVRGLQRLGFVSVRGVWGLGAVWWLGMLGSGVHCCRKFRAMVRFLRCFSSSGFYVLGAETQTRFGDHHRTETRHIDGSSWVTSYGQSQAKRETQVLRGSPIGCSPHLAQKLPQARFDAPALAVALRV